MGGNRGRLRHGKAAASIVLSCARPQLHLRSPRRLRSRASTLRRPRARTPNRDFRRNMQSTKAPASVQLIMRSAPQPNIADHCFAAPRPRLNVIELEPPPRLTAPSVRRDERTLPLVAYVDLAPNVRRNVPCQRRSAWRSRLRFLLAACLSRVNRCRAWLGSARARGAQLRRKRLGRKRLGRKRLGRKRLGRKRLPADRKASRLLALHELSEHELHQARQIALRQSVARDRPRPLNEVAQLPTRRKTHTKATRRERF
jgi:hypothetical protein